MVQSTANCPITCEIDTQGISDAALSFNDATGAVTVSQFDYSQDSSQTQITVTCTSDLSESPDKTASETFVVTYEDECRTADF